MEDEVEAKEKGMHLNNDMNVVDTPEWFQLSDQFRGYLQGTLNVGQLSAIRRAVASTSRVTGHNLMLLQGTLSTPFRTQRLLFMLMHTPSTMPPRTYSSLSVLCPLLSPAICFVSSSISFPCTLPIPRPLCLCILWKCYISSCFNMLCYLGSVL